MRGYETSHAKYQELDNDNLSDGWLPCLEHNTVV